MVRSMIVLTGLLAMATVVKADIAPPPGANNRGTELVVVHDPNAKEPKLVIPRRFLQGRGALDADDGTRLAGTSTSTIVAGIAIAFSLVAGGLWLARRNRTGGIAMMLAAGLGLTVSSVLVADIPPGPRPRPQPPLPVLFSGKVAVEVIAAGDTIRLVLPTAVKDKIGGNVAPAPGAAPPASRR